MTTNDQASALSLNDQRTATQTAQALADQYRKDADAWRARAEQAERERGHWQQLANAIEWQRTLTRRTAVALLSAWRNARFDCDLAQHAAAQSHEAWAMQMRAYDGLEVDHQALQRQLAESRAALTLAEQRTRGALDGLEAAVRTIGMDMRYEVSETVDALCEPLVAVGRMERLDVPFNGVPYRFIAKEAPDANL